MFSFGVVLLEIVTGREPLDVQRPRSEWSLVEWVSFHCTPSETMHFYLQLLLALVTHLTVVRGKRKTVTSVSSSELLSVISLPNLTPHGHCYTGKAIHTGLQDRGDRGPWHKGAVLLGGHVEGPGGGHGVHRVLLDLPPEHGGHRAGAGGRAHHREQRVRVHAVHGEHRDLRLQPLPLHRQEDVRVGLGPDRPGQVRVGLGPDRRRQRASADHAFASEVAALPPSVIYGGLRRPMVSSHGCDGC